MALCVRTLSVLRLGRLPDIRFTSSHLTRRDFFRLICRKREFEQSYLFSSSLWKSDRCVLQSSDPPRFLRFRELACPFEVEPTLVPYGLSLSGGHRLRLEVACITRPPIDEATTGYRRLHSILHIFNVTA